MKKRQKKSYSPEFRTEVAELVVDKNYSVREAAESMDVGKSTVDKWARLLRLERNGGANKATPITPEQQKIKALEREIQTLKMEKDILKKATALLMSDSMNDLR